VAATAAPARDPAWPAARAGAFVAGPRPSGPARSLALKLYFLAMALGLVCSSGIVDYLAFASRRDRRLTLGLLAAGVILPVLALLV
jgi:hypothetical protein